MLIVLFLPVFGHFALTMFFLGGLGFLRLLWMPFLDVSFNDITGIIQPEAFNHRKEIKIRCTKLRYEKSAKGITFLLVCDSEDRQISYLTNLGNEFTGYLFHAVARLVVV